MQTTPTITLPYVIPDPRKVTGFVAGNRPYREGGVRLEKEKAGGKTVYHDYGHGGAGISIAYGCAQHVVERLFLEENVELGEQLAVLGAGIVGLTTALLLAQRGYTVKLYAELTPFERQAGKPQITTTVAAGYWMPLKVGNKGETAEFARATWQHYGAVRARQEREGRKLGVSLLPAYVLNDDEQAYHFRIPGVIEPADCLVTFGDRIYHKSKVFPTYVVETALYCQYLRSELEATGRCSLHSRLLKSREEVAALAERHVFNCLGLGAREVFGDAQMRGIKGHIVGFRLDEHQAVKDFLLVRRTESGGLHLQVPQQQSGNFMLGVSFEEGERDSHVEPGKARAVLEEARNFYLQVQASRITAKL